MIRHFKLTIIFTLITIIVFGQSDTNKPQNIPDIFGRIAASVKKFQLDTSAAPDDKITKKIKEVRSLRGGFNINEVVDYKIQEDRQKNEVPKNELDKLSVFFKSGDGKRWLDNAAVWIYRQHFSYNELKQLVRFYKTSAGQKMATDFPIIMMESLTAAEMIKNFYAQKHKNNIQQTGSQIQ